VIECVSKKARESRMQATCCPCIRPQRIFDMQLRDPSGETSVLAAKARFLTPPPKAAV
jgi:hypothetical protein